MFNFSDYLVPGENVLAAQVYRWSDGSYLEDQDFWRLSGIFRDVYLWAAPTLHVRDFFVQTDLDADYRDANLKVSVKVRNYGQAAARRTRCTLDLVDAEGASVFPPWLRRVNVDAGDEIDRRIRRVRRQPGQVVRRVSPTSTRWWSRWRTAMR